MPYNNLLTEVRDGVLLLTINREAKLNALNMETMREIREAMAWANGEDTVRGIIITGAGSKAFVAGADISEFADFTPEQGLEMARNGHATMNAVEHSKKVVIAAVNGFALGGGCELAMACHIRVASDHAKFGQPEVNLGIIPGYGGTQRLIQLVGKAKAIELLLTADVITADKALECGLVNYTTPGENLLDLCFELMQKMTNKSLQTMAKILETTSAHFQKDNPGFEKEMALFAACMATSDFKEGTTAFLEKRKAAFSDR